MSSSVIGIAESVPIPSILSLQA
uniref:Uncharacterized protein n=1 Tax=Arundo donax TaxID=35708 RepID=A0A0A9A905_ARUDO